MLVDIAWGCKTVRCRCSSGHPLVPHTACKCICNHNKIISWINYCAITWDLVIIALSRNEGHARIQRETSFGIYMLNRRLHRLIWVYTCQNAALLEIYVLRSKFGPLLFLLWHSRLNMIHVREAIRCLSFTIWSLEYVFLMLATFWSSYRVFPTGSD